MYSIGENLNVINKGIGKAFKEKDPGPIREMAEKRQRTRWILSISTWGRPEKAARS